MIDKDIEIVPGMYVVDKDGLSHGVEDIRISTIGYEKTHQLGGKIVNYVQLGPGKYPAFTKLSKDEEGFREHFTPSNAPPPTENYLRQD